LKLSDAELVNRISASDSSLGEEDAAKRAKAFTNQTQGLLSAVTSMGLLHIIDASASNVTAQVHTSMTRYDPHLEHVSISRIRRSRCAAHPRTLRTSP